MYRPTGRTVDDGYVAPECTTSQSIYDMDRAELNVVDMYDSSNGNEQTSPRRRRRREHCVSRSVTILRRRRERVFDLGPRASYHPRG